MISRISFALALCLPLAAACTDSSSDDEFAADDATEGDASKADAPGATYTYYFVQQDIRRCAAPYCGGVWYRLANATQTRCLDGKRAERCYAASEDWAKAGLDEAGMQNVSDGLAASGGELLVRATIASKDWGSGLGVFAELRPSEAWVPQVSTATSGPLALVTDSGIRCITYPCASLNERKLNSTVKAQLSELGWDTSGATEEQVTKASEKLSTDGVIVAGDRYTVSGPAGDGKARTVTQFWLRATNEPAHTACVVSGCSSQICADQPMFSTCEFRPEYACYQSATCEPQADGTCGWTATPELQACLGNP